MAKKETASLTLRFKPPALPKTWDCAKSIKKVKNLIGKREAITKEQYNELCIARAILSKSGAAGHVKNLSGASAPLGIQTWSSYCKAIGHCRGTVNRWLREHTKLPKSNPKDDITPKTTSIITHTGDLWVLGPHRLLCGDATKLEDVHWLFYGDHKADLCFTSPPYNIGKNYPLYKDSKSAKEYYNLLFDSTALSLLTCDYVFIVLQKLSLNRLVVGDFVHDCQDYLADELIWDKKQARPSSDRVLGRQFEYIFCYTCNNTGSQIGTVPFDTKLSNIIRIGSHKDKNKEHPATFPVALSEHFIYHHSEPNSIIYDSFAGTGTVIISCEKLNRQYKAKRRCFAIDMDKKSCSLAVQRWQDYTKQKAYKCNQDGFLHMPGPDGKLLEYSRRYMFSQ